MKKTLVLITVLGLALGALAAPAVAKKKKAKPVASTLFAHGPSQLGEIDGVQWTADGFGQSPFTLDGVEPAGGAPKSMTIATPALNSQCTGLPSGYPSFIGNLTGTIKGDAKLTAHFVSAPGTIKARLWADVPVFTCNDAYIEPASEVDVELPGGQAEVEIVFPDLNLKVGSFVNVEILAPDAANGWSGQVGRLLYDSTDAPTRIEFGCIPAGGAKTCVPE